MRASCDSAIRCREERCAARVPRTAATTDTDYLPEWRPRHPGPVHSLSSLRTLDRAPSLRTWSDSSAGGTVCCSRQRAHVDCMRREPSRHTPCRSSVSSRRNSSGGERLPARVGSVRPSPADLCAECPMSCATPRCHALCDESRRPNECPAVTWRRRRGSRPDLLRSRVSGVAVCGAPRSRYGGRHCVRAASGRRERHVWSSSPDVPARGSVAASLISPDFREAANSATALSLNNSGRAAE